MIIVPKIFLSEQMNMNNRIVKWDILNKSYIYKIQYYLLSLKRKDTKVTCFYRVRPEESSDHEKKIS